MFWRLCRFFKKGEKMPRTRWTLPRSAQDEYLVQAKWLASAGAAIEIPEPILSEPSPLRITQYGPQFNHIVFNRNQFRVGVVVGVRLLALQPRIEICDCHFALPWEDPELFLWDVSEESKRYRFTKRLEFDREEVFNSRIVEGLSLRVGEPVEGLLIATGSAPLPTRYCHGAAVSAELTFVDQFDRHCSEKMELLVNRREGETLNIHGPRKGSTLFASEDFKFEDDESLPKNSHDITLQVGKHVFASGKSSLGEQTEDSNSQ
jgi:hypothetical protein